MNAQRLKAKRLLHRAANYCSKRNLDLCHTSGDPELANSYAEACQLLDEAVQAIEFQTAEMA